MSSETSSINGSVLVRGNSQVGAIAARFAIGATGMVLIVLAALHILSPEFDPSWRMVSEYANGGYSWVLSLMFTAWAIGTWTLAVALWPQVTTRAGKAGVILLVVAGIGEAMAAVFDITQPMHEVASALGILGLPIAAMLVSVNLSRIPAWAGAKKPLLWSANLTWGSIVLMAITFGIMIGTFMQSGVVVDPNVGVSVLPEGVIGLVGWANRLVIIAYCAWAILVASLAVRVRDQGLAR